MENKVIRRGDIWIVDLEETSSRFSLVGQHPCIIISNYKACENSPLIQVIPISSKLKPLPVHIEIQGYGLSHCSTCLIEQLTTIGKESLIYQIGRVDYKKLQEVQRAIDLQLGLSNNITKIDDLREVIKTIDEINEMDRYLEKHYDAQVMKNREIALKYLSHYLITHSINVNLSQFYAKDFTKKGREVYAGTI